MNTHTHAQEICSFSFFFFNLILSRCTIFLSLSRIQFRVTWSDVFSRWTDGPWFSQTFWLPLTLCQRTFVLETVSVQTATSGVQYAPSHFRKYQASCLLRDRNDLDSTRDFGRTWNQLCTCELFVTDPASIELLFVFAFFVLGTFRYKGRVFSAFRRGALTALRLAARSPWCFSLRYMLYRYCYVHSRRHRLFFLLLQYSRLPKAGNIIYVNVKNR